MIRADDLVQWVRSHAINDSLFCLGGWIRGSDLLNLAYEVVGKEPFDYRPPSSRAEEGEDK